MESVHGLIDMFWTGGTDAFEEGRYVWSNSFKPIEDFFWATEYNEPDGVVKQNSMCLVRWLDYKGADCNDNEVTNSVAYPICQME